MEGANMVLVAEAPTFFSSCFVGGGWIMTDGTTPPPLSFSLSLLMFNLMADAQGVLFMAILQQVLLPRYRVRSQMPAHSKTKSFISVLCPCPSHEYAACLPIAF